MDDRIFPQRGMIANVTRERLYDVLGIGNLYLTFLASWQCWLLSLQDTGRIDRGHGGGRVLLLSWFF